MAVKAIAKTWRAASENALALFFQGEDYGSVITLAGAADGLWQVPSGGRQREFARVIETRKAIHSIFMASPRHRSTSQTVQTERRTV
jgi:hypothetical protein